MIKSIHIANTATYNSDGADLENMKLVNFVYGSNGSGKTTISKVINNPESYAACRVEWENDIKQDVYVYNRDFYERNFRSADTLAGIFTLGEATAEDLNKIKQLQDEFAEKEKECIGLQNSEHKIKQELTDLQSNFPNDVWSVKKNYEVVFNEALTGCGKKSSFAEKLLQAYHMHKDAATFSTYSELENKAQSIFAKELVVLPSLAMFDYDELIKIEGDELWEKIIVGSADVDIAPLIKELGHDDWVLKGKSLLRVGDTLCPFCQQKTITDDFRKQLEDYFDESFLRSLDRLKELQQQCSACSHSIYLTVDSLIKSESDNPNTKLDVNQLKNLQTALFSQFQHIAQQIESKIKEPNRAIVLDSSKGILDSIQALILAANVEIKKHNDMVANIAEEKANLTSAIWAFMANESAALISKHIKDIADKEKTIKILEEKLKKSQEDKNALDAKIKEANKHITSVQSSVDEINRVLELYGFQGFRIAKANDHQYQIQRADGSFVGRSLSEGEETFITFLYFMQLVKGGLEQEKASSNRVVVIDDPVSSLDSTVLFIVSSMIVDVLEKVKSGDSIIKQVIILTHNVYFHKEVTFLDNKYKACKDVAYYVVRKNIEESSIECSRNNPIKDSYEMLWYELKNRDKLSLVTIQNTMRRICENYFKILGKMDYQTLYLKFENIQEKQICRSLISWINDGSHCIQDDMYMESPDTMIDKYMSVFKKMFEVTGQVEHYNMMMKIINE